jgi:hypothetical protein
MTFTAPVTTGSPPSPSAMGWQARPQEGDRPDKAETLPAVSLRDRHGCLPIADGGQGAIGPGDGRWRVRGIKPLTPSMRNEILSVVWHG